MTKDHNPRRSDSEWEELIAECRQSGLSDDCWCRNNGIPVSTFYNAVSRLRKKACHVPAREQRNIINLTSSQDVVPIDILPDAPGVSSLRATHMAADAAPMQTDSQPVMEIRTGNAIIRVPNGTDPQLLAHVFRLIGGL